MSYWSPTRQDRTTGLECICTGCEKHFVLSGCEGDEVGFDLERTEIDIRSCDSGGIYAAYVSCPHCQYEHRMW